MTAATLDDPETVALKKKAEGLQTRLTELSTKIAYGEPKKPAEPTIEQEVEDLERVVKWKENRRKPQPPPRMIFFGEPPPPRDPALVLSDDLKADTRISVATHKLMRALEDWSPEQRAAIIKALNDGGAAQVLAHSVRVAEAETAIPPPALAAFEETTLGDQQLRQTRLEQIAALDRTAMVEVMSWLPTAVETLKAAGRAMVDNERAFLRGPLLFGPAEETTAAIEAVAAIKSFYGNPMPYVHSLRDMVEFQAAAAAATHDACLVLLSGVEALAEFLPESGRLQILPVPMPMFDATDGDGADHNTPDGA